jgi:flagellin-like protein
MRKGITPTLSVVILTMMVVSLAASTSVWLSSNRDDILGRITSTAAQDLEIEKITCNGNQVRLTVSNNGQRRYSINQMDLFVHYDGEIDPDLTRTKLTPQGKLPPPDQTGVLNITAGNIFQSDETYVLDMDFYGIQFDARTACRAGLDWWNLNWNYRRHIVVENTGGTKNDAIASATFNSTGPIGDGKLNPDCSDIRAVEGKNVRDYTVSGCGTTTTTVKFETNVDASAIEYDTYLYYGNIRGENMTTSLGSVDGDISTTIRQEEER